MANRQQLPRLDTTAQPRLEQSLQTVEARLISAVADVLRIPKDDIQLYDSFTDLGGDLGTANALSRTCMSAGMALRTSDILRCATLAELQTCITPFLPLTPVTRDHESDTPSRSPSEIFSPALTGRHSSDEDIESCSSHSHSFSHHSGESGSWRREEIESILLATAYVASTALVRPKAGYFEGKEVVFLTFAGTNHHGPASTSDIIKLIPQSQVHFAGSQVASLKQLLEASIPVDSIPLVWIILETMPLNSSSRPDRRKLQSWAQNMSDDLYQQVMALGAQEVLQEPGSDMEVSVRKIVSRVLRVPHEQVGMNFSFAQLGGDDISALQMVAACRTESILLKADDILNSTSLAHLAFLAMWKGSQAHRWNEESLDGFGLSPMQQLYFQTAMGDSDIKRRRNDGCYRFNQSLLLRIRNGAALEDVQAAIEAVVGHHSMLRSRFRKGADGWTQRTMIDTTDSYEFAHHSVSTDEEVLAVIGLRQASIDIENGPVFAADHFDTSDGQQMLYIIAHHLVVDLISWRVIIQDLDELLQNGSLFSERSMPFQRWVELQQQEVWHLEGQNVLPFSIPPANLSYWGLETSGNTYGDALEVSFSLGEELTSILQTTCNQVFRTDSADIYLTALLLSFVQTFHDRSAPAVWNQEHGREAWSQDIDIAETVGWFTSVCPISLGVDVTDDFVNVLRRMKDVRRSVPRRGWAYFASKAFNSEISTPHDWPLELVFTYAGSLQQLERENGVLEQLPIPGRTLASKASDIGPEVGRVAVFEVSAMVDQGAAKVKFIYNRNSRHQERISAWVHNYEHLLLEAIGRLRYRSQELTLADVPLLNTTYEGLAKLNTDRLIALKLSSARDIEAVYPVTAAQQEILVAQTLQLESCHNHAIHEFVSPTGEKADAARICTAWQQTVAKHPALRTVFIDSVSEDGLFDQVVLRKCSPNMLFIDAGIEDDGITALMRLPTLRSSGAEPRHRLTVCTTSRSTFMKLDISQALCDATGVQNVFADLKRAYTSSKGSIAGVNFSYPDYLLSLQSARLDDGLDFWRNQLRDTPQCLFPRLAHAQDHGIQTTHFDLSITASHLDSFTQVGGISRGTILRLAWGLALRAFTGTSRVCFGYKSGGREGNASASAIITAVGSFETTVVCALDLWAYKSLAAVLRATEDQLAHCLPHQHISISEVQHGLNLKGDGLFNTCLSFTDESPELKSRFSSNRPQITFPQVLSYDTTAYDISLATKFIGSQLVVDICHRILTPSQAQNMANTFSRAIEAILSAPNGSIGGVDLFTDRDYAQLVQQNWETEPAEEQTEWCVHHLIQKQVREQPEAPAVCAWDGEFSYRQLAKLVSRLSHYLVDLGVRPGVAVPVVLEKSRWATVAILAVMKAGGCFVPLDGDDQMNVDSAIKQLGPKIVLATEMAWKDLEASVEGMIIVNDALFSAILPSESPSPKVMPTDAACVLFSPGSPRGRDGRGIVYTHSSLSAAFLAQGEAMNICSTSRVTHLSCPTVDTALVEILATLVHGGCVCIPSAEERIQDFATAVNRMNANWTYLTPVLARRLDPSTVPTLETVCFRTRRLDEDTYAPWVAKARVLLAYGAPDICPLGISVLEVTRREDLSRIARPFLGKFWIVNPEDHRRLMPIGTVGELVIEGPTLAHKFIPGQPLLSHTQEVGLSDDGSLKSRYFKTGHRVRYMEDGMMEFVSSTKDDVAVEGKVIPVAEVEQQLRRCLGHGVDVVVDAITTRDGVSALAAFIELGPKLFDGTEDLSRLSSTTKERAYIAKRLVHTSLSSSLPAHMVPSVFVPVKHMPITPSLKVNRRKLQKLVGWLTYKQLESLSSVPSPDEVRPVSIKPLPLTQVEERMRSVWSALLKIPESDITGTHSFSKLGGDHFLAAQLVVACRREGLALSLNEVIGNATLTELCHGIAASEEAFDVLPSGELETPLNATPPPLALYNPNLLSEVVAPQLGVDRAAVKDFAEASDVQIRGLESAMLDGRAAVNYLTFGFNGFVPAKRLEMACQNLCKVHPILRSTFITHNRKTYQVDVKTFTPDFKRYLCPGWRLSGLTEKMIKKDQMEAIAFGTPITKFMFVDAGKTSTLIVRLSTAQYDEASIGLLLQDLKTVYCGVKNPPRRPTYFDFVRAAQLASMQGAQEHWTNILEDAEMTQVIVHSKPRQLTPSIRTIRKRIPIASLSNLGISFDTILKSAWAMVLATLSGSGDVVFGEVIEGRHLRLLNGQGVSGVLGPAANAIPVRVQFANSAITPLELFQYVHGQRVASIPFENLGFLQIVEKCTKWPYWTKFSTAVQHRHRDELSEQGTFNLGNATCKFNIVEAAFQDAYDIFVCSTQQRSDRAEISLRFCENRVPVSFADDTLKLLCSTIEMLTSVSMMHPLIPSADDYALLVKQLPLPHPEIDAPASNAGHMVSTDHRFAIQGIISAAWTQILDPRALGVPESHIQNAAFFDLWGSLLPASQIAEYLTRELPKLGISSLTDISFSMEEIVENPTMLKQFELVARKMSAKNDHRRKTVGLSPLSPTNWGHSIRRLTSTVVGPKTSHEKSLGDIAIPEIPTSAGLIGHGHKTSVSPIVEQENRDRGSMDSMTSGSTRSDEEEVVSPMSPSPLSWQGLDPVPMGRKGGAYGSKGQAGSHGGVIMSP
jgi:non-ribosomal peptide synthetase component F